MGELQLRSQLGSRRSVSTPTHNQVSNDTPQHQCTLPVFLCAPAPTMILRVDDRVRGSSPLLKRSHLTFDRRETG